MITVYRPTALWVVIYRYKGQPRRWYKAFAPDVDVPALVAAQLRELHGEQAQLEEVRTATADEELQYLRGETPVFPMCPTGRH